VRQVERVSQRKDRGGDSRSSTKTGKVVSWTSRPCWTRTMCLKILVRPGRIRDQSDLGRDVIGLEKGASLADLLDTWVSALTGVSETSDERQEAVTRWESRFARNPRQVRFVDSCGSLRLKSSFRRRFSSGGRGSSFLWRGGWLSCRVSSCFRRPRQSRLLENFDRAAWGTSSPTGR
jgi:hypothetical protein